MRRLWIGSIVLVTAVGCSRRPAPVLGSVSKSLSAPVVSSAERPAAAATQPGPTCGAWGPVQPQLAQAAARRSAGDYAGAAQILLNVAETFPAVRPAAAMNLLDAGREDEAYLQAHQAVSQAPFLPYPHFVLAFVAIRTGRLDEALAENEQTLALHADTGLAAATRGNIGQVHYLQGNFAQARVDTELSLKEAGIPSSVAISWTNLSELSALEGDLEAAEADLGHALDASPDSAAAYYQLATIDDVSGHDSLAAAMEREALKLDLHQEAWRNRTYVWPEQRAQADGLAGEARGDLAGAEAAWKALLQIECAGGLHWTLLTGRASAHLTRLGAGNESTCPPMASSIPVTAESPATLTASVSVEPSASTLPPSISLSGDTSTASSARTTVAAWALSRTPAAHSAPKLNLEAARTHWEDVLRHSSDQPSVTKALVNLAAVDAFEGKLEASENKLNQAMTASPDDPLPYSGLAHLYDVTARHEAAIEMESDARSLDPSDAARDSLWRTWPELRLQEGALDAEARGDEASAREQWKAVANLDGSGSLHWSALASVSGARLAAP